MMILITPRDFSKLSMSCRQELLAVFTSYGSSSSHDDMNATEEVGYFEGNYDDGADGLLESGSEASSAPAAEPLRKTRNSRKRIIEIDVDQARRLIENVSPRSKKVLEKFVSGELVSISTLIGPDKEYHDLRELKKSLVGGVNRRLRTVTEDRAAVLFISNQDRSAIRIAPTSAASLRPRWPLKLLHLWPVKLLHPGHRKLMC